MYGGDDSRSSTESTNNRETLQLSPHIAAHKSICPNQGSNSVIADQFTSQNHSSSLKLSPIESFNNHIPVYRTGIPTSAIYKAGSDSSESIQPSVRCNVNPANRTLPQDLTSNPSKTNSPSENKTLPTSQNSVSQSNDNYGLPVLVSERPPTYYRLADGTTIAVAGQHQTILLSTLGNDPINSISVQNGSPILTPTQGSSNSDSHHAAVGSVENLTLTNAVSSIPEDNFILPDIPSGVLPNPDLLSFKEHLESKKIKKESNEVDQKDLVKQALQATIVQNGQRATSSEQEIIEYNYSAGDIAGSDNCLVEEEDVICHSTFCHPPNFKTQELLMMNIHVSNSNHSLNKASNLNVVPSNLSESPQGSQVVLVQSTSGNLEDGNVFVISPSKRRRSKLNEAAQAARRERVASRMREKRANESEDQKIKRRIREAERMRRKRAMEDEDSKSKRRKEAAERARIRRAQLSPDERELERQKAARRMRLRRQNENEDQKRVRRLKAAERMRKRRATETPEEREARKHNIAIRMKNKRKKKEDDSIKMEENINNVVICEAHSIKDEEYNLSELPREGVIVSEQNGQYISQGHIVTLPGNITLLQTSDSAEPPPTGPHLIPMGLASIPPISTLRKGAFSQKMDETISNEPLHLHKLAVITQGPSLLSHPEEMSLQSRNATNSSTQQSITHSKIASPSLINSHHLPHILNHNHLSSQSHSASPRIHENLSLNSQHQQQTSSELRQH